MERRRFETTQNKVDLDSREQKAIDDHRHRTCSRRCADAVFRVARTDRCPFSRFLCILFHNLPAHVLGEAAVAVKVKEWQQTTLQLPVGVQSPTTTSTPEE